MIHGYLQEYVQDGNAKIENCKNYANITGYNMAGGISAFPASEIINCINYGNITLTGLCYDYGGVGGIIGYSNNTKIENSINEGKVIGNSKRAGGIAGCISTVSAITNEDKILNCVNKGESLAGIVGWIRSGKINIINCYNIGECSYGIVNELSGPDWNVELELNLKNCYNLGKVTNAGILGTQGTICASNTLNMENCYNGSVSNKAIVGNIKIHSSTITITNVTNTYYDTSKSENIGAISEGITGLTESEMKNNETFVQTLNNNIGENTDWKRWKIGENGYPTFE